MADTTQDHVTFQKCGGLFEFKKTVLKISGPDAADFLHRLTTQNVKNMVSGTGAPTAVLNPNAMLISLFDLYNCGQFFLAITDVEHGSATAGFFEKFHFAENLAIQDISEDFSFLSIQGAQSGQALQAVLARLPARAHEVVGTEDSFVFCEPDFGSEGFHLLIKNDRVPKIEAALQDHGFVKLSSELWTIMRIEAGFFSFGADLGEKNLILEGALDSFVSRNKGCYPGQEVVERVFTYGNVAKKLVGLRWPSDISQSLKPESLAGLKLFAAEKEVGMITSAVRVPWSRVVLARAMVRKPHYQAGEKLRAEGVEALGEVYRLPHTFEVQRELKIAEPL